MKLQKQQHQQHKQQNKNNNNNNNNNNKTTKWQTDKTTKRQQQNNKTTKQQNDKTTKQQHLWHNTASLIFFFGGGGLRPPLTPLFRYPKTQLKNASNSNTPQKLSFFYFCPLSNIAFSPKNVPPAFPGNAIKIGVLADLKNWNFGAQKGGTTSCPFSRPQNVWCKNGGVFFFLSVASLFFSPFSFSQEGGGKKNLVL